MSEANKRLIFALDVPELAAARAWSERLGPHVGLFKVGLELFSATGPEVVRAILAASAAGVFLDLKLHDIPITVERAARVIGSLGVRMLTVHAQAGVPVMEAAVRGAGEAVRVLAVTRLTSEAASPEEVSELALAAREAGCAGVVCAGTEAATVRKQVGPEFLIVCPGVRPAGAELGDQVRVVTPRDAMRAGADYIVVGRPIRDAEDPVQTARAISEEIARAL